MGSAFKEKGKDRMSSVSGSGSGMGSSDRAGDSVRRNREEYQEKESELVKRQQRELRRMAEAHQMEMDRLRTEHSTHVENLKENARENMSARDMQYQKEISDLRALQRKQLQNVTQESDRELRERREAMDMNLKNSQTQSEDKTNRLEKHYGDVIKTQNQRHSDSIEELREKQANAIRSNHDRLSQAHKQEKQAISAERDNSLRQVQNDYAEYRRDAERRIQDHQIQNMRDKERMSGAHMTAITRERQGHEQREGELRSGYNEGIEKVRERYNQANVEQNQAREAARQHMADDVEGRYGRRSETLQMRLADQKDLNNRQRVELQRQNAQEVTNVRNQYQKNIDLIEERQKNLQEELGALNKKDVEDINRKDQELLKGTNQFYRDRLASEGLKNKEAISNMQTDFSARHNQEKVQADTRVQRVLTESNNNTERLTTNQREALEMMKIQHTQEQQELRAILMQEKHDAMEALKNQLRDKEAKHIEQVGQMKLKYDKQIGDLGDQLLRERKQHEEYSRRIVADLKRGHDLDMENLNVQYQARIRQIEEAHTKELKAMTRRNDEKMEQLVSTVKKNDSAKNV